MTPDQRARRMVGYLPPVLQTGARVNSLFQTLAQEMGEMERLLTGLMRSRWYMLARGFDTDASLEDKADSELGLLGALYGLSPRRGESADYFRGRIATMLEVHRTGLSNAPALLRMVSLVYMAQQPPNLFWEGPLAVGEFLVPTDTGSETIRVTLADNPSLSTVARFRDIIGGQRLPTFNKGLDEDFPEISLTATEADISIPVLHHLQTGLDVLFLGRVPKGQTLKLRNGRMPQLDGRPVLDIPILLANPTRFSDKDDLERRSRFNEGARFALFDQSQKLPVLQLGDNHWSYDTLSRADLSAYLQGTPGLEQALKAALPRALETKATPRALVEFKWNERARATFALRIPAHYVPLWLQLPDQERQVPGLPGLVRELVAALNYGRAAGVRFAIEFTLPGLEETVTVTDDLLSTEVASSFTEKVEVEEGVPFLGSLVSFTEQLPEPDDSNLTWSGFFDHTRFDSSRFQP